MTTPHMMRAVEITQPGGPDVLCLTERPVPTPRAGEVVLKLAYAGVNRPDALQRAGAYDPPPTASDLPGLEGAGEVVAVGEGVSGLSVGDQVCALLPGGGYAEYVATPAAHALPIPKGMDLRMAACLPETFFYGLVQRVHARWPKGGRTVFGPWRIVGDRDNRDPIGQGIRRAGVHDGRQR